MANPKSNTINPTSTSSLNALPPSTGMNLLALFRVMWSTFQTKQNSDDRRDRGDHAEYEAAYEVVRTTSHVRPATPMEALAQAAFLHDEASDIDQANTWTESRCQEWSDRMMRRASYLADWIERTHALDSREYELNHFYDATQPTGR